jgi:hypothetical protein
MKKNITKTSLIIAVVCFSISMGFTGQAKAGWIESYYQNHPMTIDQLNAAYGEPVNVIAIANNAEKRVYGPKDAVIGYTYFIVADNKVVTRGVMDSTGSLASNDPKAPEAKGIMAKNYRKNPLSVKDLKAELGSPVAVCDYKNGSQKMFYGPKDAVVGYTYYLAKDGMVVDQNVSNFLESNNETEKYAGPEPKGIMAKYYAANPMTVEEQSTAWQLYKQS